MRKNLAISSQGLAIFLAILMVYVPSGIASAKAPAQQHYDGETIFRGIFMADGPAAKLFPEIWESPQVAPYLEQARQERSSQELSAARQKLIDLLKAQDPTFFTRFGAEMQSGDRIRVQQAIAETGTRMQKIAASQASPDVRPVYLYLYLVVAVVGAVAVAVAAVLVFLLAADQPDGSSSNLQRDVMVDLIAQRLGPASAH